MQPHRTARRSALSAVAVALIAVASFLFGNSAQAASNSAALDALLPLLAKSAAGARVASKAQVLPAPTGTGRPFRQTMGGDCNFNVPDFGYTLCRFPAIAVTANQLLEIQNISCFSLPGQPLFLLARSGKVANLFGSVVAVATGTVPFAATTGGPFYVAPGERIFIWGLGEPESYAVCTVYGLLSPID